MSSWWKGGRAARPLMLAGITVAIMAAAASCSPRAGGDANGKAGRQDYGIGSGNSGLAAFLAGRMAQAQGDTRAAAEYYAHALKFDPENVDLLNRAFTLMVAEGRMDEAKPLAERLLAFDSDGSIPLMVAGIRDVREKHFAQAEARFAALPKRGVNGFLGPLLTAWSRAGDGRTDAALEALSPLASVNGLAAMHAYHSGLINDLAGRDSAAEASYQVALSGTVAVRTVEAAGSFYQRAGQPERARQLYDRYFADHPDTLLLDRAAGAKSGTAAKRSVPDVESGMAEALFDVASILRQGNARDPAMVFARLALALQSDFPLAQMMVGDMLSGQGRWDEANAVYRSIARTSPAYTYGRLRAAMNQEEAGDAEGALSELSALAVELPGNLDPLVTKGDVLRRKKRFEEAAKAYSEALRRAGSPAPHHWALYFSRGICLERVQQWDQAEADMLKALELQPDQPEVLNYLGYSWVDRGRNLEQGRAMIEQATQLRPKDGAIVDSLGWALYRMGDFQGAVKHLERAIELKAEDPTINDHLGDAYFQVGRYDEALFQWKRAMGLDPEPEQILPLQEKIRTGQVPAKALPH